MKMLRRGTRKPVNIDEWNPEPVAQCDGCGFVTMYSALKDQRDYRGGDTTVPTGYRVCGKCYDVPNQQLRKQRYLPDPEVVKYPRPVILFDLYLLTEGAQVILTEDGVGIELQ